MKLTYFFFFNDTATTEIYTLSLHDALPILRQTRAMFEAGGWHVIELRWGRRLDRKSTRLNSSHSQISYAVFCLKKKNTTPKTHDLTGWGDQIYLITSYYRNYPSP